MELLLTGEPITASDAWEWGLINQVVKEGSVVDAALALAARVTVNAPAFGAGQQADRLRGRRRRHQPPTKPAGTER